MEGALADALAHEWAHNGAEDAAYRNSPSTRHHEIRKLNVIWNALER